VAAASALIAIREIQLQKMMTMLAALNDFYHSFLNSLNNLNFRYRYRERLRK